MACDHGGVAIPTIIDTDIGTNIDDTWALALALRSPELDVQLVTVATGDTDYRAQLAAEVLNAGGRDEVSVARGGAGGGRAGKPLAGALEDFDLAAFVVGIEGDAAGAIIDTVMEADEPVTIVAIGPLTNLASALARDPEIATRARVVSMHGSLEVGYADQPGPAAEYNAAADVEATRAVHAAGWEVTVAPLDVTNAVVLAGDHLAAVRGAAERGDQLMSTVLNHHHIYLEATGRSGVAGTTTPLHDTVAVHLACGDESLLKVEDVRVRVDSAGVIRRHRRGHDIRMAAGWMDLGGFLDRITDRLTNFG